MVDVLIDMVGVMQAVFLIAIAFLLVKPIYYSRNTGTTYKK